MKANGLEPIFICGELYNDTRNNNKHSDFLIPIETLEAAALAEIKAEIRPERMYEIKSNGVNDEI